MFFKKDKNSVNFIGRIYYFLLKKIFVVIEKIWLKEVVGEFPLNGAFIIAANHVSFLDFMLLMRVAEPQLHFFIKGKYFNKFYWKYFLKKMGQINIENGNNFLKNTLKIIKNGGIVAVFPEGTRTRTGELGEFLPGVAAISITTHTPIVPVAIKNIFNIWPYYQKWPKIKKEAVVVIGEPIFPPRDALMLTGKIKEEIEKLIAADE